MQRDIVNYSSKIITPNEVICNILLKYFVLYKRHNIMIEAHNHNKLMCAVIILSDQTLSETIKVTAA